MVSLAELKGIQGFREEDTLRDHLHSIILLFCQTKHPLARLLDPKQQQSWMFLRTDRIR